MGKCCSKRQEPDVPKKNENKFAPNMSQQKYNNGSIDRYTPDPNRIVRGDIIRTRQPTRKYCLTFCFSCSSDLCVCVC